MDLLGEAREPTTAGLCSRENRAPPFTQATGVPRPAGGGHVPDAATIGLFSTNGDDRIPGGQPQSGGN